MCVCVCVCLSVSVCLYVDTKLSISDCEEELTTLKGELPVLSEGQRLIIRNIGSKCFVKINGNDGTKRSNFQKK